jgi:hypothetical protein
MSYGIKYATAPRPGSDLHRIHPVQKIGDYFPQMMEAYGTAPVRSSAISAAAIGEC